MTDLAKTSDICLLTELVHANREAALEALYYRYNDMIQVMLREKCMIDANEMDDYLQMTWLKVFEYFDTYDPSISTQSWLFTVASSVVRNDFIARGRQKRIPPSIIQCLSDAGSRSIRVDMRVPKPTDDPAELLIVRERLRRTLEVISAMGPAQEKAIHYVFIEGLSYEEAAELLGVTKVALSATIHRVRERLRRGIAA
jgi:RNA polymerase sigma-70 factor (ECF subfamily)